MLAVKSPQIRRSPQASRAKLAQGCGAGWAGLGHACSERAAALLKVADLVKAWPQEVALVEYFLGAEQAWIFVIGTDGKRSEEREQGGGGEGTAHRRVLTRRDGRWAEALDTSAATLARGERSRRN